MITKLAQCSIIAVFALAGCQNQPQSLSTPHLSDPQNPIIADALVTFYMPNNYVYLSTQEHRLFPHENAILITAKEPQGDFKWHLTNNIYESQIPPSAATTAPATVLDHDVVQAIASSFKASAGYYDLSKARHLENVKIQGRWYQPFQLASTGDKTPKITLFMLLDEQRIDLVRVAGISGERVVTAHSYNMHWFKEVQRFVPTKIDIFAGAPGAAEPARILGITYKGFKLLGKDR